MIGFSRSAYVRARPAKPAGCNDRIDALVNYTGQWSTGSQENEVRKLAGLTITNANDYPIWVEVESEATKEAFSATIPAGQTVIVPVDPLEMYWNPNRIIPGWDGLNFRYKEPA